MTKEIAQTGLREDRKDSFYNFDLRNARINAEYSMKQIAQQVGISIPAYNSYERLRALPNPLVARRICRLLGKKPSELFPKQLRELVKEIRYEREGSENEKYLRYLRKRVESGKATRHEIRRVAFLESLQNPLSLEDVAEDQLISEEEVIGEVAVDMLANRIEEVLETLTYREREVIKLRYGIGDGYNYTLEEVGKIFKVARERVRLVEARAIRKLQHPVRAGKIEGFFSLEEEQRAREQEKKYKEEMARPINQQKNL